MKPACGLPRLEDAVFNYVYGYCHLIHDDAWEKIALSSKKKTLHATLRQENEQI